MVFISLQQVTFGYPHQPPIFDRFSWEMERGETWAILGPSGCGKTTLLYLLAGLYHPLGGHVEIDGAPLPRPRPRTGLILQDYGLLPWETVRGNVELGLRVRNVYGPDGTHAPLDHQMVDVTPWLERLGLAEHADKFPAQLSGGQRQRTAIARTLALRPDLLLMDEPFSSLDAVTREDLQTLSLELCAEQGLTLILVTHAIEEAALMGKHILLLGRPPIRSARILHNPNAGSGEYRHHQEYFDMCKTLRAEMDYETA